MVQVPIARMANVESGCSLEPRSPSKFPIQVGVFNHLFKYLGHLLLLSQMHQQEIGSEVVQLKPELTLI